MCASIAPQLTLDFCQTQELKLEDSEILQANATLGGLMTMENNLRRDGFNAVAACLALARYEIMSLLEPVKYGELKNAAAP